MTERRLGTEGIQANTQIRPMTLDHVEEVYNMGNGAPEFSSSDQANFWDKDELERWIQTKNDDVLLVATYKTKIAAFTLAMFHTPTGLATITNVMTKPEYRRRGIAKQLLGETVKQLEAKGATYIYSLVHTTNEASIKLHESVGFRQGHVVRFMEKISGK